MRSIHINKILNTVVLALAVLLLASVAIAQQQVNMTAAPSTAILPDGTSVPMWGYSCDAVQPTGTTASCASLNSNAAGHWSPVLITVPTGQSLTINLTNSLSFPAGATTNNIPTSIVIVGQLGGGLGSGATYVDSPNHTQQQVTWPIANTGAVNTPPPQGKRVQSMATEVQAGTGSSALTWNNLRAGTYLLESGTHPSIQVPMGLIGVLVVTTPPSGGMGTAYPGVTYSGEVPLEFSEIDPVQNNAVNTAVTTAGFNENSVWTRPSNEGVTAIAVTSPGAGYSSAPTVTITDSTGTGATATANISGGQVTSITVTAAGSLYSNPTVTLSGGGATANATATATLSYVAGGACGGGATACYPPAVNYTPLYYLINGQAFDKTNATRSQFSVSPATGVTGNVLVRLVNAGLKMHVPSLVGAQTTPAGFITPPTTASGGFSIVAEDGNVVPGVQKVQSDIFMAAGKTFDVMINAPSSTAPAVPVFDRELSLSGNSSERDAGMLGYISINGSTIPTSTAGLGAPVVNPDTYNSLIAGQTFTVSDASKGVIANDVNVYGVQLSTQATNGVVTLNTNGTFTYVPNSGSTATSDSFGYCANGSVAVCTTVTLGPATLESARGISMGNVTYTANTSTYLKIASPGVLAYDKDAAGYPLQVVTSSVTPQSGLTVVMDQNGGFKASVSSAGTYTFTYSAKNSQGTQSSGTGTVTLIFPTPNAPAITVMDPKSGQVITDYRWIIEEDKTFYVNPNCTGTSATPISGCPTVPGTGVAPSFGVNFHTSHMETVAQGCFGPTTGALSCEYGQTVLNPATGQHVAAVCDLASGACDLNASQETPVNPSGVFLDPGCGFMGTSCPSTAAPAPYAKRYYISVLPGDAADPFNNGNTAGDCNLTGGGSTSANCGHSMGGAEIAWNPATNSWNPVTVLVEPTPFPPGSLSVQVFEDDFPLNGEQDAGGGIDVIATNEPGLGGFNIVLWDVRAQFGDATGQMTYDMFNQPLGNSLDGTIDPATGLNACPITQQAAGITGMIVTCPKYEADGVTESPLAGEAVVSNLMPVQITVEAYPGADRFARGEEWLQTNTLDGQHPHDAFIRVGEPTYFQEYGPAGFHVQIGFANPAIINSRYAGVCAGTDLNVTATNCTNTVTGKVTTERLSRTPDQRLYSSGSRDAFYWTQCYVSLGDPDGEDFMFTKCDADGNFTFTGVPTGSWRMSLFDQWNDQLMDGLSTPVNVGNGNNQVVNMGDIPMQQWQSNVYTRTFVDDNKDGVYQSNELGIPFLNTTVRYRDGSMANNLLTDFSGTANFNETFPLFNWYVVEADTTRYKTTGIHTVYDVGGPADGSASCGTTTNGAAPCGSTGNPSWPYNYLANTYEPNPLPADLSVPGAVYCASADCSGNSIATGPVPSSTSTHSSGRIDPGWVAAEGWQGFIGQSNFIEFGKAPYAAGENGGIHGHVIYASTRPFDDPTLNVQQPWEPLVPHVTMNLYKEGFAADGITPTLTLVDTTQTSSWDDWAQGFRADGKPNMNCPGQGTGDPFYYTIQNQPNYLDLYNAYYSGGTAHSLAYNSQYKCYDGMHSWNQLQPAPYDGMYSFPSVTGLDPTTGKPTGTNCTACISNPDSTDTYRYGTPMLPVGKYVVEVVLPSGYELVKEEDKNILIGDNFIAPVTQEFGGLGNIFIIPDQASVASTYEPAGSAYNPNNAQNPTQSLGTIPSNNFVPGFLEPVWPCVGELRTVPDYMSIYPQSYEVAPFAGATRHLCDRKEVTLGNQMGAIAKFYIFTSTHIAAKFTGIITDDFTSEFDPFAPTFGEKFSPPNMPVSLRDWTGTEISRVYSDQWGVFNGISYSTWEVNPPNPTGYSPTMMVTCMNDKGPIPGPNGTMITDPLFNPLYSQFCYELPFMPGIVDYMDTPVVPTAAFVGAGYNNPDCNYPDTTPAISSVTSQDAAGPWVSAAGHMLTINSLGDQQVINYGYSGPSATKAPFNAKTVSRHYGFGTTPGTVTIGGIAAPVDSWLDNVIQVTVPTGVPPCNIQQQAQYGGSQAYCGELVITAANGKQSIDSVTVTVGGKTPYVLAAGQTIQSAIDAAAPGDLIILPPGTYRELILMWKPVRLQGVGAASSIVDATPHPAGKLDPWRRSVNCLFGLALNGQPYPVSNTGQPNPFDPSGTYSCPTAGTDGTGTGMGPDGNNWNYFSGGPNYPTVVVDRIPLEGILGWDATVNGNLAEQLQEPSIMGAYEGAAITVLSKGVNIPAGSADVFGSGAEAGFPTGSTLLLGTPNNTGIFPTGDANANCHTSKTVAANPYPSNFQCNPSSIDAIGITDSSQGGGGIFVHGWGHNLQIANNRIFNNSGTLSGGISVGQGEFPEAYLAPNSSAGAPGSCQDSSITNTQLPYCLDLNVNLHNNFVIYNSSTGDELFTGTPAGAGGVSICTGADYYKFNYNWVCGNMSTGDGGGMGHLGFIYNGDIEHNTFIFNQSTNPSIAAHGGGLIIMGAAPDGTTLVNGVATECGSVTDNDCVPGLSDGAGPGLVINANLFMGNSADAGSGGGLRLQAVNGADIARFPANPNRWYSVQVTNNIITNNVAGWDGGGVSLEDSLVVNLVNNTIASNDSTASSGVLFNTLGAPLASSQSPTPTCLVQTSGTASCPQIAGVVTMPNSPQLTSSFTTGAISCPAGHFQPGTTASNGTCTKVSYPLLYNNLIWQNRSFDIGVGSLGQGQLNQQNIVSLYNAFSNTPAASQSSIGNCPTGVSYWDIGVRGDSGPSNHGSGFTLAPTWSVLTDAADYPGKNNQGFNPEILSQYCNGSRVPPENGGFGYQVPAGISDAVVPNPVFSLTPNATVDEGNNWINLSWGPLSLTNPSTQGTDGNYGGGSPLGNYALASSSSAIDIIPSTEAIPGGLHIPATDFFGKPRPDPANLNSFDIGAIEYQGLGGAPVPTLSAITPNSGYRGKVVNVTLNGTGLSSTSAITVSGAGVTVSNRTVVNDSTVTATFTITSGAALSTRNVTVTTMGGVSNSVPFTVLGPALTSVAPNSALAGTTVNITLSGADLTGATAVNVSGGGVTVTYTVASDTSINATFAFTSSAAGGTRNITVTTPNGVTNAVPFTVIRPVLNTISPTSGLAGTSVNVTLSGSGLATTTSITAGAGITVSNLAVVSDSSVTATFTVASNASAGVRNVHVTTAAGANSNNVTFTVVRPALIWVLPASGLAGTSVNVTLTGSGLSTATSISAGSGITVSNLTVVSDSSVTATFTIASGAAAGARNVTVTINGGAVSNGATFTVNRPALTGISPAAGTHGTNVPITLAGSGLTGTTSVKVSGTGITVSNVTVVSDTQVTATFGIAGTASLTSRTVTTTNTGGANSNGITFTVN